MEPTSSHVIHVRQVFSHVRRWYVQMFPCFKIYFAFSVCGKMWNYSGRIICKIEYSLCKNLSSRIFAYFVAKYQIAQLIQMCLLINNLEICLPIIEHRAQKQVIAFFFFTLNKFTEQRETCMKRL